MLDGSDNVYYGSFIFMVGWIATLGSRAVSVQNMPHTFLQKLLIVSHQLCHVKQRDCLNPFVLLLLASTLFTLLRLVYVCRGTENLLV